MPRTEFRAAALAGRPHRGERMAECSGNIFSGQAGGWPAVLGPLIGNMLAPKQMPIRFETIDGEHRITVPGLLEALLLAATAYADPYNPGERAITGGLLGAGTGAVIGAIAGGGMALGSAPRSGEVWAR